ncbi:MAG: tRNA (adenosine(37)-N6)-dimethylallyltransferase MiaA [Chloroflexi bacterium]|nr:tRNA (adenosine(37)-N6)-dimethylallyltransferase MiaA [Chloroflexota bacterium]
MNRLVAIIGPTGIGKSRLALRLAQQFNGEIVSADSRQIYRHLDIGTAKPSRHELSLVTHHLIDVVELDDDFSLAQYQQLAYRTIEDIQQRHKLAFMVGGSGLYVWSVLEGWEIPPVPPDPEFRRSLAEKALTSGTDELYQELIKIDPQAAQRIDRHNVRRVIRALEVSKYAEAPFSQLQGKEALPFNTLIIGLTTARAELYRRIDLRVDEMIKLGLVDEVRTLLDMGYSLDLPAMSGIGYKQIGLFLKGELTLENAIEQMKFATHRFVRHQYSWFRLGDSRIHWFDIKSKVESEIAAEVADFISGKQTEG